MSIISKKDRAQRRANRVRAIISGTSEQPRVSCSVSLTGMFVQFIDDQNNKTVLSGRSHKQPGTKTAQAQALGKELADKAKALGITKIKFDRGAKQYHGRVQALAEALRAGGLVF
ncbi:MAG: 50S ribosomal protein L18 [Candidatus Komeilibacteria bacterium]|nr:50S ribosomal protein L18 [Candidatus Komeilibacteria bacterium]